MTILGPRIRKGVDCTLQIPNVRDTAGVLITSADVSAAKAQLRTLLDPFTAPNPVYEWSLAASTISIGTGTVNLKVSAAVSALWTFSRAWYDVLVTDTAGKVGWSGGGLLTLVPVYTLV